MTVAAPDAPQRLNWLNISFLIGTFLVAAIGTPWYLVRYGFGWPEWVTCFVMWLITGLSITAGYHRLYAHRTYEAAWPIRFLLVVFGAAAFENSVLSWAADHRLHHDHTDHDKDPYNIQKGFWWAHIGWIFFDDNRRAEAVVRDLKEDRLVVWQDRFIFPIGALIGFGIPLLVGLATDRVLGCLLIGGVLRVVISHHGTFFINSACHFVGTQPYSREHSARDSAVMAFLAFGEGYHNYHHSFPYDYRNGIKAWHFDPAKWLIWALSKVGLARGLRRASELQVLRAKATVQLESARDRLARFVASARAEKERRLDEAHAALDAAIQDLISWERKKLRAAADDLEHRLAAARETLESALAEWRAALRDLQTAPSLA